MFLTISNKYHICFNVSLFVISGNAKIDRQADRTERKTYDKIQTEKYIISKTGRQKLTDICRQTNTDK